MYPMNQTSTFPNPTKPSRLVYLDALRGFDMFWIIGGESLVKSFAVLTGWGWAQTLSEQFEHVSWDGFKFYDFIFPLFLFIAGVSLPISLGRRQARGESRRSLVLHILVRTLFLIFLGVLYNNGGVTFDISSMRIPSVLGRIGLASGLAAVIVLNFKPRGQAVWAAACLVGYSLAMKFIPVPGHGAGDFSLYANLASHIDRWLIPGRLYVDNIHDPEGLFSTIPSVATALFGALAGSWMLAERSWKQKTLGLLLAGLVGLGLGLLWHRDFPINKNLWSSSFAVFAAGWSCLFLAAFYLVVEVLGWKKWAWPFVIIGSNSILVYFLSGTGLINFGTIARFFFGFTWNGLRPPAQEFISAIFLLVVEVFFLYLLYRNKVFIREGGRSGKGPLFRKKIKRDERIPMP